MLSESLEYENLWTILYCDCLSLYLRDGIEFFDGKWEVNFNGLLNRY